MRHVIITTGAKARCTTCHWAGWATDTDLHWRQHETQDNR